MKFKNKAELLQFIKIQTNVNLENDKNNILNNKRNLLYTNISKVYKITVLSLLNKHNIMYEKHINDNYFIYVK